MQRLIAISLLLLCALSANAEIRLYEVSKGQEVQISEALMAVLALPDERGNPSGVIELLPGGQLLVNTTPELHADIKALIETLKNARHVVERNYRVHFWVLFIPDSSEAAFSRQAPLDEPRLLNALNRQYDGRDALVLMQASANSIANRSATLNPLQGNITFRLRSGPAGLSIEANAAIRSYKADSEHSGLWSMGSPTNWNNIQAVLQPNEYLVLAENNQTLEQQPGRILLVIQWDESGS